VVVKIEIYKKYEKKERYQEREGSAKPKTGIVQINLDISRGPRLLSSALARFPQGSKSTAKILANYELGNIVYFRPLTEIAPKGDK